MDRRLIILLGSVIGAVSATAAPAAEVHKWTDADGLVHYSDTPPPASATPVSRIDLEAADPVAKSHGYYSITNQWARMHRESLEREKLRLEQARVEAMRQPPTTDNAHTETPAVTTRYVRVHPVTGKRLHGRFHAHYKTGNTRDRFRHRHKTRADRKRLGFYKHVE